MIRRICTVAAFLGAGGCGDSPGPAAMASAIRDSLARAPIALPAETMLVAFVERAMAESTADDEATAELALLRLRALDRVLRLPDVSAFNPWFALPGSPEPPAGLRAWIEARSSDVVFSEPAALWLVPSNVFWELHDRFEGTRAADEIAWEAAQAGFPGECEGVAGCYLGVLLEMAGRYLEEHPAGAFREDALESVRSTLESLEGLDPDAPLCGDERTSQAVRPAQLERLAAALEKAAGQDPAAAVPARVVLDRLERRCGR